ncbi:MAG: RES family NAD+ phosphorylase [Pseudomonadales bacterium]|nr:RES family NAD+ phosphorylase [Gammaproteobacteria bacterium]NNL57234.1 RES family NAD+ phosphorylase [Pseudomonadales bacterium]
MARRVWRVVETQEIAATQAITESAEQQSRLEQLLDASKPPVADDCQGLSYLLYTPFRYPPLQYGSRFGGRFERGIFYASLNQAAAFAESATYLWLFQSGPIEPGPLAVIRDQRTAFLVSIKATRAIDLARPAFARIRQAASEPGSWDLSQKLGSAMREARTQYCLYASPRLPPAINVAVFAANAFADAQPRDTQHWHLRLNEQSCWFTRRGKQGGESFEFRRADFEVEGRIPHATL